MQNKVNHKIIPLNHG